MARDHARIRLDIWADDDFRLLPSGSQWLYLHLLTSPALSFCGVTDWRPARIGAVTAELDAEAVEMLAGYLEDGLYVVIDRDSEEVLIRSFIKHDGLMKSPNMAKAMATAHAATASSVLRAVVVEQLHRLKGNEPDYPGWKHIPGLLAKGSMSAEEAITTLPPNPFVRPSPIPSVNPSSNPSVQGSGDPSATPFLPSSLPPSSLPSSKKSQPHLTSSPNLDSKSWQTCACGSDCGGTAGRTEGDDDGRMDDYCDDCTWTRHDVSPHPVVAS